VKPTGGKMNITAREKKIKVAVLGSTGAVGQVFMWMLQNHPWFEIIHITASSSRKGKVYGDEVHWVVPQEIPQSMLELELNEFDIDQMKEEGVEIIFSALPTDLASDWEPRLREAGFYVFSNASSMRYDKDVPILIPEVNLDHLSWIKKQGYPDKGFVVTNANCSTTGLAVALAPLKKFGIKEINISTYQSVSGAGYPGLSAFDITDNVIPYIGGEEEKIVIEIKKILDIAPIVLPFCVRVPVMFGHLEAVWLDFEEKVSPRDVLEAWDTFTLHDPALPSSPSKPVIYLPQKDFPQSKHAFYGDPKGMVVYTGRLKEMDGRIGFMLMVNNVVRGAAGGSIQNAEAFVKLMGL
jgi:aspartate-semialdehyde dehydrogenase